MLLGVLLIIMAGYIFGEVAHHLGLPRLSGMLLCGILIGPPCTGTSDGSDA